MSWYTCIDCPFTTNDEKCAIAHTEDTGHEMNREEESEDP